MFAFLLAWATIGMTTASARDAAVQATPAGASREWTDASGTRRVRAVLIRAEGDKLWLRRSDGKLATTSLTRLSAADRQYVATNPVRDTGDSKAEWKATSLPAQLVKQIGDRVQSMSALPQWTMGSQPEAQVRLVPAALVYVRVSREFLEDYVDREVNRKKPVRDLILGARIEGESHTQGKTSLELLPASGRLSGRLSFEGTVHAKTRGYKSPVVLHQVSDSTFQSSKLVTLDDKGQPFVAVTLCNVVRV